MPEEITKKIEIEISENIFQDFQAFCRIQKISVEDKIKQYIEDKVNYADLVNF